MNQGRWNEADQLLIQVIDIGKKLPEEEDIVILNSMANLANIQESGKVE